MGRRLFHGDYESLVEMGKDIELPEDAAELHALALEVITSVGVPCYLTPYGAIRAVADFAVDNENSAFTNDGKVLMKAALAAARDPEMCKLAGGHLYPTEFEHDDDSERDASYRIVTGKVCTRCGFNREES